ncbi:MAG: DUF418 domain-containing protein [Phycisphaeraceae bacterium]|nr:DUF418 domain-containing protein [Phycisphaeraceae bacterium]
MAIPGTLAPVPESARINAIDAARGFALLGIFMVNVGMHGDVFGPFLDPNPPQGLSTPDLISHYFVKVFCEGKFYPLFSLLFGVGLAIQWQRARAGGRSLVGTGLRRLFILAVFGLAHALLLWYGDILFIYSTTGMLLLLLINCRARTLALAGAGMMAVCVALGLLFGAMGALQADALTADRAPAMVETSPADGESAAIADEALTPDSPPIPETHEPRTPIERAMAVFGDPTQMQGVGGPLTSPVWMDAEREAYRDGPFKQAFFFRAVTFASMLVFCAFGFWWNVAAMFLFGAAMLKAGLFEPRNHHWHKRLAILGLGIGLPASLLYASLPTIAPMWFFLLFANVLMMVGGPILSLGYLCAITLLVRSGAARTVTDALAKVGRMALTNYLLQSLLATGIFYWWGLGLFGETTKSERVGIVLGIYAAQVAFSVVWLRFFRFGPMEWVWRSLTYLRPQPMLRRAGAV